MTTFILATRNQHKVQEIQAILGRSFRYLNLGQLKGAPSVVEDQATFAGNATKKAVILARWMGHGNVAVDLGEQSWVLADDSGLEVDALHGAPGVHSARFAALDTATGGNSSDDQNNAKLLRLLVEVPRDKRTARFRCTIALVPVLCVQPELASSPCSADELELQTQIFDGACEGMLDTGLRGHGGFGYDPLFIPEGHTRSFAELGDGEKNRLSHRAYALRKLRSWFDARAR